MNNMSNGESDGLVIMYCKDKKIYPVALRKEDLEMLDLSLGMCLKKINIINQPLGEISNLLKK